MQSRHSRGDTVRIFFDIINAGVGATGLSATIAIQRRLDSQWFQASDGTWVGVRVENAMTQSDVVNLPGRYQFDFDQSLDLEAGSTEYIVKKRHAAAPLAQEFEDLVFGPLAGAAALELCSIQGTVSDGQGLPSANVLVRATLIPIFKDSIGRTTESDRVLATYTNELGDFDLPLIRGGTFRLEVVGTGYDRKIVVPDQSSILFTDL